MAVVFASAVLAGCGGEDKTSGGEQGQSDGGGTPQLENATQPVNFKINVSGSMSTSYEGPGEIRILATSGNSASTTFTVGTSTPVAGTGGQMIEVFMTLVDQRGSSAFEIKPGGEAGEEQKPGLSNTVYANVYKASGTQTTPGTAASGARFDAVRSPCTGKLSDGGAQGTMTCDSLAERGSDKTIKVSISWEATGPRKNLEIPKPGSSTTAPAP